MATNATPSTNNEQLTIDPNLIKPISFAGSNFFKRFDINNDVVMDQTEVTEPLFVTCSSVVAPYFTQSGTAPMTMTASFLSLYNIADNTQNKIFDIAYGVFSGSETTATRYQFAAYSALRTAILDTISGSSLLLNGISGTSGSHKVVAISLPRTFYKQRLDEGTWDILISSGNTATQYWYMDNYANSTGSITRVGLRTNIVSGNIAAGILAASSSEYVGYCYHDLGLLLFDANKVKSPFFDISVATTANSASWSKIQKIEGRSSVKLNSAHYFCRAFNKEFNYSTNPTFVDTSTGKLKINDLIINGTKTYITTVGLYNDQNELLAVAKLSQPVKKSFDLESIINVRLDY